MALLPEHDDYVAALDVAYAAFRVAFIDSLGLQDNPQFATLDSVRQQRQAYDSARVVLNRLLTGGGPSTSSNDDLKGYNTPGNPNNGSFALNPLGEALPKVAPLI